MGKTVLTPDKIDFIKKNRLTMSTRKLAKHLNCSKYAIQRYLKKNGLNPPPEIIEEFRKKALQERTTFTPEQDEIIKKEYLNLPVKTLAEKIGKSFTGVSTRLRQLGLEIPKEVVEKRKQLGRFKKGQTPLNKGKKMSKDVREKVKHTWFQEGHLPHNTKRDGEITVRYDRRGVPYKHIRLSLGEWVPLHRHVWESNNGPIPEGYNVVFKDGDTLNSDITNLEMISNQDNMERNTIHNYPEEIKTAIKLKSLITKKLDKNGK